MYGALIAMVVYLFLLVGIPAFIGVYVYRDALQRGMNALLWTLIAVLAPAFIGLVIYLLTRGSYPDLKCPECASSVTEQYAVCPQCGARLKDTCPNCGFASEPDWVVCPKCASPLPEGRVGYTPPLRKKDKALGKILLIVICVPLLLLVLIGLLGFSSFNTLSHSSSMNTAYVTQEHYENRPEITQWLKACEEDPSKAYALHYEVEQNGRKATHYLVYIPQATQGMDIQTRYQTGLFGAAVELRLAKSGDQQSRGTSLTCISNYSDSFAGLRVFMENARLDCEITEVDYNPALFELLDN